jgi:WD40 repeat protein
VNRRLHSRIIPDLKPHKSWKGASNDVIVSTWSPDGSRFAAGATTQCDEHNMEYNRGNNLILGNLATNSLKELPDHWVPRPAGRSNQNVVDSRLYMSVTALQWFEDLLFSASYDNTVKLWDATNHANAHCVKSLHHSSKVQVMARSTSNQNILATGSKSIGLWNIDDASYSPLDITRPYKKDVEMTPTSLVWGGLPATNKILLAGLSEKESHDYDLPHGGLLAMWFMHEASMVPVHLTPNSQNVFDIKWHPSLPVFATANSLGPHKNPASKDARSVVRTYQPLVMKSRSMEFDCPALDINDITFCPSDLNYITASCTDGITYVWDRRRPDQIVHRLEHDPPLNQMDENLTREQADVGVRLALWGGSMDQFYTGASDGVLRRWNILRAPEDALVDNVMSFPEEIMCGTFSEDKSNLLVGDCAGGVHVLSSSPFPYEPEDRQMRFERAAEPDVDNSDSDSGIAAGDQLVSSGQLVRHPVYGVGQGPYYKGPFAAWARPKDTPRDQLARTPLDNTVQAQQLDGAPVKDRLGLDDKLREDVRGQIQLARIRNWRNECKRKRYQAASYVNLVSEEDDTSKSMTPKTKKRGKKVKSKGPIITRLESGVIDLTADTGYDELEDDLADDFWWPDSGDIDPNIGEDMS